MNPRFLTIGPLFFCLLALSCADNAGDTATEAGGEGLEREEFEYTFPAQEILDIWAEPYTYPYKECFPVDDTWPFDDSAYVENEAGEQEFCICAIWSPYLVLSTFNYKEVMWLNSMIIWKRYNSNDNLNIITLIYVLPQAPGICNASN